MRSLLIIRHEPHEGPGILADMAKQHGLPMDVVDYRKLDALHSLSSYGAILVMGGPQSANDTTKEMQEELRLISDAFSMRIPYFGVCLGLQVGVKAAGGSVRKNAVREAGPLDHEGHRYSIELTSAGKSDPLLVGIADSIPMFHAHGETVEITPTMTLLATGTWCENQIVKIGPRAYGIQGHLELTDDLLAQWKVHTPEIAALNQDALDREWKSLATNYRANCEKIFTNFLRIAELI